MLILFFTEQGAPTSFSSDKQEPGATLPLAMDQLLGIGFVFMEYFSKNVNVSMYRKMYKIFDFRSICICYSITFECLFIVCLSLACHSGSFIADNCFCNSG